MKPETAAWVAKAEADFISAGREFRARISPNYDSACFHAQQSAEKYLKAVLVVAGVAFPKIHSLTALLHLILPVEPSWSLLRPDAAQLTIYAVEFRYPGKSADKLLARDALIQSKRVREFVRLRLGLPVTSAAKRKRRKGARETGVASKRVRRKK